ncbi:unknown [Sutterella wadsworthensis CAG:135]|nr:unknown [Sutterella wadsworthensis CAG:135]
MHADCIRLLRGLIFNPLFSVVASPKGLSDRIFDARGIDGGAEKALAVQLVAKILQHGELGFHERSPIAP